jgi:hypothetical protein
LGTWAGGMLAERVVGEAAVCEVDDKAKDSEDDDDEVEPAEYMHFDAGRYTEVLADEGGEEG